MKTKFFRISSFCKTGSGTTPSRNKQDLYYSGNIPWVKSGELRESVITETEETVTEQALSETPLKLAPKGAVLVAMYGANVGRVGILGINATTNQAICHVVPEKDKADSRYLFHALRQKLPEFISRSVGGAQPNISQQIIRETQIPLPPIAEQKRIAAILDKAEELRAFRRKALGELDTIVQSIFLEMFGDPAINPKKWQTSTLGAATAKFSDGPFGSNLKTSHYTEAGIRVVRLQNIGIGDFNDNDRAYINPLHFESLRKHECLPGDVLIATLGAPNLRACIQPDWLLVALNKADCVQARPKSSVTNAEYLCALLNQPSTERMAHDLILGETRLRISMGRLRTLVVPIPPITLQQEFARRVEAIEQLKSTHRKSLAQLDALFASLQHRAFRGEL